MKIRKNTICKWNYVQHACTLIALLLLCFSNSLYAQSSVNYIKNDGQWEDNILYKAELSGGYLFVEEGKITIVASEAGQIHSHEINDDHSSIYDDEHEVFGAFSYQVEFLNSKENIVPKASEKSTTYHNYFTSPDPKKWRSNVELFEKIAFEELYEGVDLVLYGKDNLFEYDFVIHPNANVNQIAIKYNGIDKMELINGQLHLYTPLGTIVELAPIVYQEVNGIRKSIRAKFTLNSKNEVAFEILEDYDLNKSLIIDPVLVFSTYSGSTSDNWGFTATYDNDGNFYSGGIVFGNGYPHTIGGYDTIYSDGSGFASGVDIGITKYTPDGRQQVYATYLGGTESELPHSIIVTDDNELVVYGTTGSADYPTNLNAYDRTFNGGPPVNTASNIFYPEGSDIIITKFNAAGTNLIGSTFFGGTRNDGLNTTGQQSLEYNYGDLARGDVTIADNNDVLFASCTFSDDVPLGNGNIQTANSGGADGLIARLNSDLSDLIWANYYGGSGDDAFYSIELLNDEVILAGGTNSSDLVGINGFHSSYQGGQTDGLIVKFNSSGTALNAGTYVGTNGLDQTYFLEVDRDDNIYVYGQSLGNYPVSTSGYSVANATQFIHEFNNELDQSIFSTVFGSAHGNTETRSVNISPTAFLVDFCKNIYAIGWGGSVNNSYNFLTGTTDNMETTADAFEDQTDGNDFYLIVLENNSNDLLYASYFGELGGRDHVDGGTSRFDKNGFVYHANCASCGGLNNFPTTDSVWSINNGSSNCNMGSFKFEFEFSPIVAATDADPISGCPPLEVNFSNFSNLEGEFYLWDFDDGTTSTLENPSHTFDTPGTYDVEFIIIDSSNCVIADTANIQIIVSDTIAQIVAAYSVPDSGCLRSTISFSNTSENANNYLWDFGDGSTSTNENPVHEYITPGSYEVILYADPGSSCGDTFSTNVTVFENTLEANFTFSQPSCNDTNNFVQFIDSSISDYNIIEWNWNFGDGNTSNEQNPLHQYDSSGTYEVTLSATDGVSCFDFVLKNVAVSSELFMANFEAVPNCDPLTLGTQFNDLSGPNTNAVDWQWSFGNGASDINANPIHFYSAEGDYDVQLIVTNDLGCSDTIIKTISVQEVDIDVSFTTTTLCNDPIVQFTNTTTSEDSIVEWMWDFGDGNTSDEENPLYEFDASGNQFVTLTATTASGCQSTSVLGFGMPVLDVDFIVNEPPGCSNLNQAFSFTVSGTSSSGINSTEWNFGDGSPTTSGFSAVHTYTQTGTYVVQFVLTNSEGCVDTSQNTVVITDSVVIDLSAVPSSCGSLLVDFNADLSTQDPISNFSWNFGDGTTEDSILNPNHTFSDTGTYTINFTVSTTSGCTGSNSITINLQEAQLASGFIIAPRNCNPFEIDLINQTTSSDTAIIYNWAFGDGNTSNDENPSHTYDDEGNYEITLTASSSEGCIDTFSRMIMIEEKTLSLIDSLEICNGDSVLLPLTGSFGDTYIWNGSNLNDNGIAQPIAFPSTTTTYFVEVQEIAEDNSTCSRFDTVTVVVNKTDTVIATSDQYTVVAGTTINLEATTGFDSYSWTPSGSVSEADISDPSAVINNDIIFEVFVTDENGCRNSDTVNIKVVQTEDCQLESLYIPNAFTPNGDGQNDQLFVRILGELDRLDFRLYNRWGELVFETDDINIGWDGIFNGKLQSTDVFGYVLEAECNEEIVTRKGNITLVK